MSSLIDSNSRFSLNPTNLEMTRSRFDMSHNVKMTFNTGQLVPFDILEVLPGDSFQIDTSILTRLQTLISPIMDNLYLDMYYFYVPNRIIWDHWKNFMGESTTAWLPDTSYTTPKVKIPSNGTVNCGSLLDYFGVPLLSGSRSNDIDINALPIRAYYQIFNDWFRDENFQDEYYFSKGDDTLTLNDGGSLLNANRYHDYFSSCLPSPQKGAAVRIPLGTYAPVITRNDIVPIGEHDGSGLCFRRDDGDNLPGIHNSQFENGFIKIGSGTASRSASDWKITPANLWTNLSEATAATINELRLAFQTQKLYEKDARGGSRYIEILKSHFGVTAPDYRLQRSELLSYNHIDFNINQVVQNSETGTTPQGHTSAYSLTIDKDKSFMKSFVEHGYIIGVCVARYKHSYQQGLNKLWTRSDRFSYYFPVFANIGEQPVLKQEIYLSGEDSDNSVFGYNEAWSDYRYVPDRVAGEMRSSSPTPLDSWHLGDYYSSVPTLSESWLKEDKTIVDRVLAVSSSVSNQILIDIYINCIATRPMPTYSIPGKIDHL